MINDQTLFTALENLMKKKGTLRVAFSDRPGNSELPFCATVGDNRPYCYHTTMEGALTTLIKTHLRLEHEALQKRIVEIETSSQL